MRTWSTSKHAAGTIVYYYHEKNEDADRVFIPGPTNEHLQVYVRGRSMLFTWYPHKALLYAYYPPFPSSDWLAVSLHLHSDGNDWSFVHSTWKPFDLPKSSNPPPPPPSQAINNPTPYSDIYSLGMAESQDNKSYWLLFRFSKKCGSIKGMLQRKLFVLPVVSSLEVST